MARSNDVFVGVEGLNKLVRDLEALGVDIADLKTTMAKIQDAAIEVILPRVPVKSGALRSTIRGMKSKNKAVVTAGKKSVPYAPVVNYGRSGGWGGVAKDANDDRNKANIRAGHRYRIQDGARFMQEADQHIDRWVEMLNQGIQEAIERADLQ